MFSYYGSKGVNVAEYPAPSYGMVVEPFAGSARYACMYHDHEVWINDKYDAVYKVWCYLRDATVEDIKSLPELKQGEKLENFKFLSDAERLLLGFTINVAGVQPALTCTKWGEDEMQKLKPRLFKIIGKIGHWKITNLDIYEMDNPRATWYIDPPYQDGGEKYAVVKGGFDFDKLRVWCEERHGEIIVCENMMQTWMPESTPVSVSKGVVHTNVEVMWHRKDDTLSDAIDHYDQVEGIHPVCAMVPDQTGDEFARLKTQIEKNGLRRAITVDEDCLILDGRHRLRACYELNIPARFETTDADPREFVTDAITHRSLSVGQRAFIANDMRRYYEEKARARQSEGGKGMGNLPEAGTARDEVASVVGVSGSNVDRAREVERHAPELAEKVKAGDLSLHAAHTKMNEKFSESVETRTPDAMDVAKNRLNVYLSTSNGVVGACERFINAADALIGSEVVPADAPVHVAQVTDILPDICTRVLSAITRLNERLSNGSPSS